MKKRGWLKVLCNLDLFLASIALAVLTVITFAAVIMRYVLREPLLWQEEAQAFCQVWMIFLGASVAFRQGSIVAIEMVVDALPEKGKKIMEYVVDMIVIFTLWPDFVKLPIGAAMALAGLSPDGRVRAPATRNGAAEAGDPQYTKNTRKTARGS